MSSSSRSSRKRHYGDNHQGSNYYKREGFLSRIFKMFGSFSGSNRKYDKHHSHQSHSNHYSDQRHYSDQEHYSDHSKNRRKYKSSWS